MELSEWKRQSDGRFWRRKDNRLLGEVLSWEDAAVMLNEHPTLKREIEQLKQFINSGGIWNSWLDWWDEYEPPDALLEEQDANTS